MFPVNNQPDWQGNWGIVTNQPDWQGNYEYNFK